MIRKLFSSNKLPENLPKFYKDYAASLENMPSAISETRFVVFDTETTGLDPNEDRILSIGAVSVKNLQIDISENLELYLQQDFFNPESVKIHGLIQNEKFEKISEEKAIEQFLDYSHGSVLVAHHAGFDVKMINRALKRMGLPKLRNKVLDTGMMYKKNRLITNLIDRDKVYSLDEIAEAYNIDLVDRHTATGDAFITALVFLKLLGRIGNKDSLSLDKLVKLKY
ncbi:3'-5' exonuclease [Christiangramia flava]|uniref:DNA polymerase III epsilon subunit n=1 Tax=Christiangramia flava JLT2011 TaxID=1229726 RepID=A0A1L7HZG9_9FLAO|nr:3'-5' exonuclease [Christiangramia flava]APU66729.1 DNA polymerase III epsilon subunit [Christiangramia flava JLT2011]OSS38367.1 DNA polymerase III, epsilon subunit [Christiangramia flava JLT2011]